jgi:hypothetical protein
MSSNGDDGEKRPRPASLRGLSRMGKNVRDATALLSPSSPRHHRSHSTLPPISSPFNAVPLNSVAHGDRGTVSLDISEPPIRGRRYSSNSTLTASTSDDQNRNALVRTHSNAPSTKSEKNSRSTGSFGRMSFSSMMGGLALGLSRGTDDKERGRSMSNDKGKGRSRSTHSTETSPEDDRRARSTSPFHLRRTRARDSSPDIGAIAQSDVESDYEDSARRIRPRTAFLGSEQSDDEYAVDSDSDEDWSDDEFDPVTESNTERNALVPAEYVAEPESLETIPDPLGEGPNVVVPPEPYFPTTLNASSSRGARRRKSAKVDDPLPIQTSRPAFARDRCTITLSHGAPAKALSESARKPKRYMVASDLSEESRYAVEWGIGTVLRDGDEMLIVTVNENESKVDPAVPNPADRTTKLRSQQEVRFYQC